MYKFQPKCKTFPIYCRAPAHENTVQCQRIMLTYYEVNNRYACPTCDIIVGDALDFMRGHAIHCRPFDKEDFIQRHVSYLTRIFLLNIVYKHIYMHL